MFQQEYEQDIDLEEAVGSYLNCLSTSCAAGSKLYTSVVKIIDEKFHEIFPDQELNNQLVKTCFQSLQIQNAFEGYQKALLECKDKLLEILIDNHTKKQQPSKDSKNKKETSPEEQYAAVALTVAKELYCYHQTVAELLKPLLFSEFQEDFENATLTGVEGKDQIVTAWCTVVEANKVLRHGYGLTNLEIGQILSWQHGGDLSESCRKRLNHKINQLIQQYVDNFYNSATCEEISIPLVYNRYPEDIQKLLQDCCSPSEALAASGQGIPVVKEEIEVMLHRELPRISLCLNGRFYDKASPGKAFENTTLKMRAIREIISDLVDLKKIDASKEQIDLFCLRVLATSSITISYASSRTAVILAFGKCNLIQVKPPLLNDEGEKVVYFNIHQDVIEIDIQSKWCITEDSTLFASLCRENTLRPIATVDVSYHVIINIEEYLVKRIEPTPIAHITQCVLRQSPTGQHKKEPGRERSKSIKIRLTKATTKLFHRKSVTKVESEGEIITNEYANGTEGETIVDRCDTGGNSSCDSETDEHPIPPPRHKRKAKKSRKANDESPLKEDQTKEKERKEKEEKKEDLGWFLSSPKFGIPPVAAISGSKDCSPSVASFEELQGVIDFLSGSSSSSLAVNEKGEKIRPPFRTHKRNNSTTSLQSEPKHNKVTPEGKLKLCHKKSASFSGETKDMKTKEDNGEMVDDVKQLLTDTINIVPSAEDVDNSTDTSDNNQTMDLSSDSDACTNKTADSSEDSSVIILKNVERTPGDGMDNRIDDKAAFNSTINIVTTVVDDNDKNEKKDLPKSDDAILSATLVTNNYSKDSDSNAIQELTCLTVSLGEITIVNSDETTAKTDLVPNSVLENNEQKPFNIDPIINDNKTNTADSIDRNTFTPSQTNVMDTCKGSPKIPLPKQLHSDAIKSDPNNSNTIPSDSNFYGCPPPPLSPNKNTKNDYEIEVINSLQNRCSVDSERHLQYRNSIDSVRCLQNRMTAESERNLPNRLLMESDRHLQNRFSADIERNLQNRILTEKNIHKLPSELERNFQNRIPSEQEGNLQNILKTESERNLHSRMSTDSERNLSSRMSTDSERTDSKIPSPVSEFDTQSEDGSREVLYEPFNSKWSVALGNKPASWSDATFDTESLSPKNDKLRSVKTSETEFTLDKQLDFNKLLEGSKFFAGQTASHESWKDRSYQPGCHNSLDYPRDYSAPHQQPPSTDPWPLHTGSHPRNYPAYSPSHQNLKRNIESLQLPPNPVGPYMRQNREQLLAKQQILEQYARHQKQLQLQQQQQQQHQQQQQQQQHHHHQHSSISSKQLSNPPLTPHTTSNIRLPYTHAHTPVDRSMSLPPGFSSNDRMTNSPQRYDMLSDRPAFRPLNQQRGSHGNQHMYNNNNNNPFSSTQSRSVNDIRMENASMMSERLAFSQMSEQNLLLEQYNQLTDAFPSRY